MLLCFIYLHMHFLKHYLFLGSGSVIHAFKDEQDISLMGGVWKKDTLYMDFND